MKNILTKIENVDFKDVEKEIIVVDDCSTDGTCDVLKLLEKNSKQTFLYHEKILVKAVQFEL